jgi:putative nucleotidyltransferase with HDIG domain
MRASLQACAKMVELRDPYTAGHQSRVGLISSAIAREMGWVQERCDAMELMGLVHDIGKIAVPAEFLSKPTKLSPYEFEIIKGHAQSGYEILKDLQLDDLPVAEIVRQHHERIDGSGYPQGLTGEQILPEAKILAVADVLESMASYRPYRPALGVDKAIAELETNSGKLYDPDVVTALLRLVREKNYVIPK